MKDNTTPPPRTRDQYIYRAGFAYAVFAGMWIFLSDRLLALFTDVAQIQRLSTVKGIAFVIVTTMLLLVSLHRAPDRARATSGMDYFLVPLSSPILWPRWAAYGFAVAITVITLLLRASIASSFDEAPLLNLFMFPIILAAVLGGVGPGLTATLLAVLGVSYFVIPPIGSFMDDNPIHQFQLGFLAVNGGLISFLSEWMHRARRQSEASARLQAVTVASIGDGVITTDLLGLITYLNPQAEHLTGWTSDEARGQPLCSVFTIINEQTRQPIADPVAKVLRTGKVVGLANHTVLLARDGRELPIHDSGAPICLADGTMLGAVLVFRDDTERRVAEEELLRANRTLRAMSLSNQALLHADSECGYLQDVCNIIVDGCGHTMAWVGFVDNDSEKTVHPVEWAGLEASDAAVLRVSWLDHDLGQGPSGTAIRLARPTVVRNLLDDPRIGPWRSIIEKYAIRSALALPLIADGTTIGVLSIYSSEFDAFSETEFELLEEISSDLVYGITILRLREEHARSERALHKSEDTYRSLFDNMFNSVVHCRIIFEDERPVDYEFLAVNPAFATVTGITQPVVGRRISEIVPGYCQDNPESLDVFSQVAITGIPTRWEHYLAALERWFSFVIYSPAYGEAIIVTENITERKLAENALRASERRFHDIVDASADWIWEVDSDGRYSYASESVRELLGYEPEEIIGKTPFELMPANETARLAPKYAAIMAGRLPFRDLYNITLHKDGSIRYVKSNGMPIFDEYGNWKGCRGLDKDNTETELAEHALRKSEVMFRRLFESAPVPLCIYNKTGIVVDCNDRFIRTFGYVKDDINSIEDWWKLAYPDPDYRRHVVATWTDAVRWADEAREDIPPIEYHITCKSGEERIMEISGVTLGEDLLATFFDVTERRKSEAAIADERRRLRTLIDTIPDMVWLKDVKGQFLACNPPFERLLGVREAKIIGQTPYDFVDAEFADSVLENDRQAMALGGPRINEEWVTFAEDGRKALIETIKTPMRDDQGRIVGVLAIGHDITEKKRAAEELDRHRHHLEDLVAMRTEELRRQTRALRAVIDNIPYLVWMKDVEGHYLAANRAFAQLNGRTMEDLIGKTDLDIWSLPMAEKYRADDVEVIRRRRQKIIFEPIAADQEIIFETLKTPILDETEEVLGTVGFARDISDQKRMEAAQNAAVAAAERLARVRREFLANMSHEIRTPLNAVLGLAQIGRRENLGRKSLGLFSRILDAGQTLLGVVDDILDFSKIEAGRLSIEHVPFVLGDVIDRAVALVAARAHEKGLEFVVEEAVDLPVGLRGDALRLAQVLGNLLSNAVKFTPSGGRVDLAAAVHGEQVTFRVIDTGIGMTVEQMARLFQPFEQADGSTTRNFGGTGLGLSISKTLVNLMGGTIRVESQLGQGSSFEVRLPLVAAALPAPAAPSGTVALLGLAEAEVKPLLGQLSAHGVQAAAVDEFGEASAADLLVLSAEALVKTPAIVAQAREAGRHVALVLEPDHLAVPCPGTAVLERPLRVRHLLAALRAPGLAVVPSDSAGNRLAGWTILAAEDNDVNRLVLEEMLSFEGARLTCVENGRVALDRLRQDGAERYDMVLTDVQMPEMDGYQLARTIAILWPGLPVIGISAHAMAEERAHCLEAGMAAYITKPVDAELLVTTILNHLPKRSWTDKEMLPPAENVAQGWDMSIDWTKLDDRYRKKPDFLKNLLLTVQKAHANTIYELREALVQKDHRKIAALAHAFKGTVGNLMLQPLLDLTEDVEHKVRDGHGDIENLVERLVAAVESLHSALVQRLARDMAKELR